MEEKTCRTCKFWGPECRFDEEHLRCYGRCRAFKAGVLMASSVAVCVMNCWEQRPGQPLGVGVLPFWLGAPGAWDDEAGIYHDLLVTNGQTRATDREWLRVELLLAKRKPASLPGKVWHYTKALCGYPAISIWRGFRELVPAKG